ncbi:MAG: hypothetical protein M3463_03635 [Verrucomicrobiota bacterium]|nr:hypothetical protein [Verrucomicrobiota bacterium]
MTLELSKHENRNCSAIGRRVDCLLLTSDSKLVPNHLHYGYERPLYIHVFADHYHPPWYQHYSLARDGATQRVAPGKKELLTSGEATRATSRRCFTRTPERC